MPGDPLPGKLIAILPVDSREPCARCSVERRGCTILVVIYSGHEERQALCRICFPIALEAALAD